MLPTEASKKVVEAVRVTREDIARAKCFASRPQGNSMNTLADLWLEEQDVKGPKEIQLDTDGVSDVLALMARSYSLRMALYQAVWELIGAGELLPAGPPQTWMPKASWRTSGGAAGLDLEGIACSYPKAIQIPPLENNPPVDVDLFLQDLDCDKLDLGIRTAIDQALGCYRRGLYLPAIAMLTAAAEATWIECGTAVAKKLANQALEATMSSQYASLSRQVTEVRQLLSSPAGKPVLRAAHLGVSRIVDAELWTTALRDRRNALHWGKAKSFIAQHGDAASLLLGAPIHLRTLEAIRTSCQ